MSARERNKGMRGAAEAVKLIRRRWPDATPSWQSGGQGGGDVNGGPAGVVWEIKRTERFRLREAWVQCEQAAGMRELPVVAHRWNGGPWLAILPLGELLELLEMRERLAELKR